MDATKFLLLVLLFVVLETGWCAYLKKDQELLNEVQERDKTWQYVGSQNSRQGWKRLLNDVMRGAEENSEYKRKVWQYVGSQNSRPAWQRNLDQAYTNNMEKRKTWQYVSGQNSRQGWKRSDKGKTGRRDLYWVSRNGSRDLQLVHGSQDGCYSNGYYYNQGEWGKALDGCNICHCLGYGKLECTTKPCGCKVLDTTVEFGTILSRGDGCNVCTCSQSGKFKCTKKQCSNDV